MLQKLVVILSGKKEQNQGSIFFHDQKGYNISRFSG